MILYYTGLTISAILFFVGLVFFILGIYFGFKAQNPYDPQTSPPITRLSIKYSLGFGISWGLALFTLSTTENEFSLETVCVSVGLIIMLATLVILDNLVRAKTITFLYKRGHNISVSSRLSELSELKTKIDKDKKMK